MPGYFCLFDSSFFVDVKFKYDTVFHMLLSVEVLMACAALDVGADFDHVPRGVCIIAPTTWTLNYGYVKPSLSFAHESSSLNSDFSTKVIKFEFCFYRLASLGKKIKQKFNDGRFLRGKFIR